MLTIRTFLKETRTRGIGLFAAEPVPKGNVWWKDDDEFNRVLPGAKVDALPDAAKEFIYTYGSLNCDGEWYICLDNGRFVNHSDDPNTMPTNPGGLGRGDWVASKDIKTGDEITSDYRMFCATCKDGLSFVNTEGM